VCLQVVLLIGGEKGQQFCWGVEEVDVIVATQECLPFLAVFLPAWCPEGVKVTVGEGKLDGNNSLLCHDARY